GLASLLSISEDQARLVRNPLQLPQIRREVDAIRTSVVTLVDDAYPQLLREIVDPPPLLHVRGRVELLDVAAIAVVGSRRASPYATNAAARFSRELAEAGVCVISGLARGIDSAAHDAALAAGGTTVAVLGTGIDIVYPRSNRRLFDRIADEGLLVSEFPLGAEPKPIHFPIRNRIIAGLSLGAIVVEASARSGSLITARLASEQGREVFAVPGSIFSAGSAGTHALIQSGAKLLHTIDDLFDELPMLRPASKGTGKATSALPPHLEAIVEALSYETPTHIDVAAEGLQRTTAELAEPLLQLELLGLVRLLPGGRYVRVA
ncbi:MAG TPA: DNA-processing protein DprA, partial [Thermoanaerobaculia bacterium]